MVALRGGVVSYERGTPVMTVDTVSQERLELNDAPMCLLDTMYYLNGFRKSTPPQNRQLNILVNNSKLLR